MSDIHTVIYMIDKRLEPIKNEWEAMPHDQGGIRYAWGCVIDELMKLRLEILEKFRIGSDE